MVFEEGLDISGLPEVLKEDLKQLDQLEGQFRLTSRVLLEPVDLDQSSPRKGPTCGFCDVKVLKAEEEMGIHFLAKKFKLMKTLSKVILSDIVGFFYQSLLKVEVGSAMYKKGIRWTIIFKAFRLDGRQLVLVPHPDGAEILTDRDGDGDGLMEMEMVSHHLHDHPYGFQDMGRHKKN